MQGGISRARRLHVETLLYQTGEEQLLEPVLLTWPMSCQSADETAARSTPRLRSMLKFESTQEQESVGSLSRTFEKEWAEGPTSIKCRPARRLPHPNTRTRSERPPGPQPTPLHFTVSYRYETQAESAPCDWLNSNVLCIVVVDSMSLSAPSQWQQQQFFGHFKGSSDLPFI